MRILVVEDEPNLRDTLTEILEADGHSADSASNGAEGLEKVRAGAFDLVITDLKMPVMCGDAMAIEIEKVAPGQPVIMLTGHADALLGRNPRGVKMVLSKPPTLESLRHAVSTAA